MLKQSSTAFAIALVTTGLVHAQNDECAGALPVGIGITTFDTSGATTSSPAWPCASGGADIWFTVTAANSNNILIELCGSSFDTAIEAFSGPCSGLLPIACNDDLCGLQSSITIPSVATGTTYTFRVGGFASSTGAGQIRITEVSPPPPPPYCIQTLFQANNGGSAGGAVYFDVTVAQAVSIGELLTNTSSTSPVGMTVYTTPGTAFGNESNMAAWTMVAEDDGLSIGLGENEMTPIRFVTPFALAPGNYGVALVGENLTTGHLLNHRYTSATGTANHTFFSADGIFQLHFGTASNTPFSTTIFNPRIWNGRLCRETMRPGFNYCGPAPANSTGNPGAIRASGSAGVGANDLVLHATDLPANATTFFLTSRTQDFVMNPAGSQGNLCLGGQIGRYVGLGQIRNSGAIGSASLAVDNTMQPTPTGFVQVMAGDTWNYQAWHRDIDGFGGATSNLTDGLSILHN